MAGTLIICGTPIGNLEDISARALRILHEADIIAAEDTRHTLKLLNHFNITATLTSYHQHNAAAKGGELLAQLQRGKTVALVTDAGMPAISDPGEALVRLCHENGVAVTAAPGPTALTTALALSGMPARRFVFEGFLPQNKADRQAILSQLESEQRTLVFYEAPHHLKKMLTACYDVFGDRHIVLVREITKKFEQIQRFCLSEALAYFDSKEPKGEYVVIIEGMSETEAAMRKTQAFASLTAEHHVAMYMREGLDEKAAMKAAAKDRGVSKREIYAALKL
jgi:16S rRNA (cytidine1402-2'-O)-methyltransferase